MSVNKYAPHLVVIPEDEADRQYAIGFFQPPSVDLRRVQVRNAAGGWMTVLAVFEKEYVAYLRRFPHAHVVLLIDFDGNEGRRDHVGGLIPDDLAPRVFVFGSWQQPELARRDAGISLEKIGRALADECVSGRYAMWGNEHFAHNAEERGRAAGVLNVVVFAS